MAVYYLDTSALVKRYAQERGTVWMLSLTDVPPSTICTLSGGLVQK